MVIIFFGTKNALNNLKNRLGVPSDLDLDLNLEDDEIDDLIAEQPLVFKEEEEGEDLAGLFNAFLVPKKLLPY